MLTKYFLISIQYEGVYFSIYFTHTAPDDTVFHVDIKKKLNIILHN